MFGPLLDVVSLDLLLDLVVNHAESLDRQQNLVVKSIDLQLDLLDELHGLAVHLLC